MRFNDKNNNDAFTPSQQSTELYIYANVFYNKTCMYKADF